MNIKNTTALEDLFQSFCYKRDDDEDRQVYKNPVLKDGMVYATDLYRVIFCDQSKLDFCVGETKIKLPNFQKNVPEQTIDSAFVLTEEMFEPFKTADEMVWVGKDVECDECNGEGTVEWEYRSKGNTYFDEFDCPICLGSGCSSRRRYAPTGRKIVGSNNYFIINEISFDMQLIYPLINVQKVLGKIRITALTHDRARFQAGDCTIVIMGLVHVNPQDEPSIMITV